MPASTRPSETAKRANPPGARIKPTSTDATINTTALLIATRPSSESTREKGLAAARSRTRNSVPGSRSPGAPGGRPNRPGRIEEPVIPRICNRR